MGFESSYRFKQTSFTRARKCYWLWQPYSTVNSIHQMFEKEKNSCQTKEGLDMTKEDEFAIYLRGHSDRVLITGKYVLVI